ncbi:MarR family winged helix-turn-helix transcriptional regulator [Sphingosinicella microcystinivorans]|uniref:MarR family transcriptional regulator n=1 Tax=Sphingosinicella microcystinivorans TaxID=335406 RepID=A0AAD1D565_SPHMI|nr:MarR family transcriptional regulator [Sphingosinicella microcystinivorans]RKS90689.1 DNA-binding MarR family transcriptional regulator [Sphingosinicella microcystinivorans]BBE33603.1 MarR family transcriptional regulator [Sphingosinicella microcystinivorans]
MSESLGFLLSDSARLLKREFDARARTIGVTRPQWRVLIVLKHEEGINQGELADRLEVEAITVGRMVDRLQEAGIVERRADPNDRRAWRLYLTPHSRALMEELRPVSERMIEDTLEGFTPTERATFVNYLERVRANLQRQTGQEAVNG